MKTDEHYMEMAIAEARQARNQGELPFGAVVTCNGEVISQNRCREATEKTVLAHAELHALNDACKALGRTNLGDCVIYSTNEPCLMCAAAIFQARIPRIVIGAARRDLPHLLRPRKFRIEHLVEDAGYHPVIVRNVLRKEVLELFDGIQKP
jgi:tRNA(Arg) A34 adenosine deaminase TadA